MLHSALINVMVKAARRAGRSLKRDLGEIEHLQVSLKGPANFVTMADRRADSSHPMDTDGRFSLVHWKKVTMIITNMMAAPPIHMTAPPSCRSVTADGPQERGSMATNGSVW